MLLRRLSSSRCRALPLSGAKAKSSCAMLMADSGLMFLSRVKRTRSSASCTSCDVQGRACRGQRLAWPRQLGGGTRSRRVCTQGQSTLAGSLGATQAGRGSSCFEQRHSRLIRGVRASNPSVLTRGFEVHACLLALSKNRSRRDTASVMVFGHWVGGDEMHNGCKTAGQTSHPPRSSPTRRRTRRAKARGRCLPGPWARRPG